MRCFLLLTVICLCSVPSQAVACLNSVERDVGVATRTVDSAEKKLAKGNINSGCRLLTRRFRMVRLTRVRIRSGKGVGSWPPGKFAEDYPELSSRIENGLAYCVSLKPSLAQKMAKKESTPLEKVRAWASSILLRDAGKARILGVRYAESLLMAGKGDQVRQLLGEYMEHQTMPTAHSFAVLATASKACGDAASAKILQDKCKKRAKKRARTACRVRVPRSVTLQCN